jgi:hypothetical protein
MKTCREKKKCGSAEKYRSAATLGITDKSAARTISENERGSLESATARCRDPGENVTGGLSKKIVDKKHLFQDAAGRQNEKQYRILLDLAPFPIVIISLEDDSFLYVNQRGSGLLQTYSKKGSAKLSSLCYSNTDDYSCTYGLPEFPVLVCYKLTRFFHRDRHSFWVVYAKTFPQVVAIVFRIPTSKRLNFPFSFIKGEVSLPSKIYLG